LGWWLDGVNNTHIISAPISATHLVLGMHMEVAYASMYTQQDKMTLFQ
jgi:hypothetical protein